MASIKIDNDFLYYGLFLTEKATEHFLNWFSTNYEEMLDLDNFTFHLSHCTLLFHTQLNNDKSYSIYDYCEKNIGEVEELQITHIGWNDKAIAFKVSNVNDICMNPTPHITIATINDGKPKDSNTITQWRPIKPITCKAIITKITKKK